jgi:serine/threonine protein kinase
MIRGDIINGYEVLEDFKTAGGGLSTWTFARRGSTDYFLKQFLAPTYPAPDAPGGARSKAEKHRRCQAFEQHHLQLARLLSPRASTGGNLVVSVDFFRVGAKYYKVTEKVDVTGIDKQEIARLPWGKQRLILLTVAHSLNILHTQKVVHGDLKPDNILIKETDGIYSTKLIDFDNSYINGAPTPVDDIVGDQVYYSPELLRYITRHPAADPRDLQLGSDIFSLGLIYTEYLTGGLPGFDTGRYRYACEAVQDGQVLRLPPLREPLQGLIAAMLRPRPQERPEISKIFALIKSTKVPVDPGGPAPGLKGSLAREGARRPPAPREPEPTGDAPRPGLRGTMFKEKPKR